MSIVGVQQLALDIALAPVPSLSNFFPGSNGAALEHLQLWTSNRLRSPVPTYLWGPTGSGKSHLLHATRTALCQQGASVGYLDASMQEACAFNENWTAVLLKDCHLYGAAQQQIAFNWFVHAQSPADGQARWVLATGALPPAELTLREDLRSRLGWGHVFGLQVLDETQRRVVLRQQAASRGLLLKDEVLDFILSRFTRDLGHLIELLNQLDRYALQAKRSITIPLLKSMLEQNAH